jgi:putative ABC transport system permease protein
VQVEPLLDNISGNLTPLYTRLMLGGTLFVLLIVCANVANLQFARGIARRPEMAMRTALGAPRRLLLRQLLMENLLLSFAGALGGLFLAWVDLRVVLSYMPPRVARWVAGWYTIHLNGRALAFSMGLAVAAGLVSGLAPALEATADESAGATEVGIAHGDGRSEESQAEELFCDSADCAGSGAGDWVRADVQGHVVDAAIRQRLQAEAGADVRRNAADDARYGDAVKQAAWYKTSLESLQALPGVKQAATTTMLPYGDGGWVDDFRIENRPLTPGKFDSAVRVSISPGFFSAFHIGMVSGRGFNDSDGLTTDPVVVVSRKFAQRYFPGENPLGHRIQMNAASDSHEPWMRIVGVSEDAAYQWVEQTPQPAMYIDALQSPPAGTGYVLMTDGNPAALAPAVRKTLAAIDATLPLDTLETYAENIVEQTTGLLYATAMLGIDAAIALLLAAIGIYGVMANLVEERRREIGVRLALGARREDVLRMILRRAAWLTGIGTAVGVVMALLMGRGIASLLLGVHPSDPMVFGSIVVSIGLIALISSWIPARRAAGVDPMEALRDE